MTTTNQNHAILQGLADALAELPRDAAFTAGDLAEFLATLKMPACPPELVRDAAAEAVVTGLANLAVRPINPTPYATWQSLVDEGDFPDAIRRAAELSAKAVEMTGWAINLGANGRGRRAASYAAYAEVAAAHAGTWASVAAAMYQPRQ